ncbi:MAG: sulfotransferase family 2 domain-containing protein [Sedimenticola sp.]
MIISHKHKYIFLKTTKTASTSVEIALSKYCGTEDIITQFCQEDEKKRKELGYPGVQNCRISIHQDKLRLYKSLMPPWQKIPYYYNHITAKEVKAYIGDDIWNSYYKFCVERNPWERVISMYYWRFKTIPRPSMSEFIESRLPFVLKKRGLNLYSINGLIAVDKVCRYESLLDELEEVRLQVGIVKKLTLPHAKSKFREDKRSFHDILDAKQKEKIAEIFCDEIALYGYKY